MNFTAKKNRLSLPTLLFATELDLAKMRDPKTIMDRASDGYTLMHFAAEIGKADLIKFLVSKVADKNAKDKWGKSAIEFAETQASVQIQELPT